MARSSDVEIQRFELTTSQLQSLLNIAAKGEPRVARSVGPAREIRLQQTRSSSGGRHTYVEVLGEDERWIHLGRNGQPREIAGELK